MILQTPILSGVTILSSSTCPSPLRTFPQPTHNKYGCHRANSHLNVKHHAIFSRSDNRYDTTTIGMMMIPDLQSAADTCCDIPGATTTLVSSHESIAVTFVKSLSPLVGCAAGFLLWLWFSSSLPFDESVSKKRNTAPFFAEESLSHENSNVPSNNNLEAKVEDDATVLKTMEDENDIMEALLSSLELQEEEKASFSIINNVTTLELMLEQGAEVEDDAIGANVLASMAMEDEDDMTEQTLPPSLVLQEDEDTSVPSNNIVASSLGHNAMFDDISTSAATSIPSDDENDMAEQAMLSSLGLQESEKTSVSRNNDDTSSYLYSEQELKAEEDALNVSAATSITIDEELDMVEQAFNDYNSFEKLATFPSTSPLTMLFQQDTTEETPDATVFAGSSTALEMEIIAPEKDEIADPVTVLFQQDTTEETSDETLSTTSTIPTKTEIRAAEKDKIPHPVSEHAEHQEQQVIAVAAFKDAHEKYEEYEINRRKIKQRHMEDMAMVKKFMLEKKISTTLSTPKSRTKWREVGAVDEEQEDGHDTFWRKLWLKKHDLVGVPSGANSVLRQQEEAQKFAFTLNKLSPSVGLQEKASDGTTEEVAVEEAQDAANHTTVLNAPFDHDTFVVALRMIKTSPIKFLRLFKKEYQAPVAFFLKQRSVLVSAVAVVMFRRLMKIMLVV